MTLQTRIIHADSLLDSLSKLNLRAVVNFGQILTKTMRLQSPPENTMFVSNFCFLAASQIWELGKDQTNTMDFAEAIDNSDLESFGFTDDFIFGKASSMPWASYTPFMYSIYV